jgi:hypothetical protein
MGHDIMGLWAGFRLKSDIAKDCDEAEVFPKLQHLEGIYDKSDSEGRSFDDGLSRIEPSQPVLFRSTKKCKRGKEF